MKVVWFIALLLCVFVAGSSARGEGLSSTAPTADSTLTPTPNPLTWEFTHNLTLGIRGDDVSALQRFLIPGGFLKILIPTGYFGPLTKTALSMWQASEGISPSVGFFGPISMGKMNAAIRQASTRFAGTTARRVDTTPAHSAVETTTSAVATTSVAVANNVNGSPVRLKIPKINVDAGFEYDGLKPDGTMEIPNNIVDVGWFTGSPRPGEKGNAIVTGHVAQIRGGIQTKPGVFSNLNELRPGDKLYVLNDNGKSIAFVVRESRNYDPAADSTDVFISKDGGVHLNLITCEGAWNPAQLSYSQRLVIFTDLL